MIPLTPFAAGPPRRRGRGGAGGVADRPPLGSPRGTLLIVALLAILFATLTPARGVNAGAEPGLLCVWCDRRALADALVNLILFVPLGLSLHILRIRLRTIAAIGFLLSLGIETLQYALAPGRDASGRDILFNTLGALTGALVPIAVERLARAPGSDGTRLSLLASLLILLLLGATGLLLQPGPAVGRLHAAWTTGDDGDEPYPGRLLAVTLGPHPVPPGRLPQVGGAAPLTRDGAELRIEGVTGPPSEAFFDLFSLSDDAGELLLVGLRGQSLVLEYRVRSQRLLLDRPGIVWRGALGERGAGEPFRILLWRDGAGHCARIDERTACGLGYTLADGWMMLLYSHALPHWTRTVASFGWLVSIFFPLGLSVRLRAGAVLAALLPGGALIALPETFGILPTPPLDAAAAVAGVLLGLAVRLAIAVSPARYAPRATAAVQGARGSVAVARVGDPV